MIAITARSEGVVMTEDETLAAHSTPGLRRNVLPRSAKKLNMEFDPQFNKMTKSERDEFLDAIYPEEKETTDDRPVFTGL